ncbi:MAG: isoprenylcysteine carboxylmethyltransferase family protein [Candidatus Moranbacteria bacterium]|jgi:protein-S-isoprenylcysteine O-methyltransferase Ste14|nr:isoprenylcysteine carboxylmethyltransferase family protein [Candidatus Moranbacteria bacterium]
MNLRQKMVSPVIMWLIVAIGIFAVFQFVSPRFVFPRNMFTSALIFPAILYWLYFFIGAILVHRKAPLSADEINTLVTSGVYNKVRHPIYNADIILGWAIFFLYPDVRFLISAHLLMFVLLFWIRLEERALTEKFGNQYLEYKKRVPKIFPKFW